MAHDPKDKSDSDHVRERTVVTSIPRTSRRLTGESGCLVVIYGSELGKKYNIDASTMIGRSSKCDVRIDQESISRNHSKIVNTGKSILIRDLGSTNGTYVNDEPIEEYVLRDGDLIKIGRTIFKFLNFRNIESAYHEELYRLTTTDGLTQVFNKRYFLERLAEKLNQSTLPPRATSLIAVKLALSPREDDEEADMALRALVRELNTLVRREDLVGRYSDRVLVVFTELDSPRARFLCEQLVDRQAQSENALLARSSVSIGLAESPGTTDPTLLVKDVLRRAEAGSRLGENRIVDYAVPLQVETSENLQSTFISYGGPDHDFAKKLNEALKLRGVHTFFFQEDAAPGEKLHDVMRAGVNAHDRVILVCSKASLERLGLLNELEETLAREARDGGARYLLPIRLDDYVINQWKPQKAGLAQTIRDRVIADFRAHNDPAAFASAVAKVMAVLTRREEISSGSL